MNGTARAAYAGRNGKKKMVRQLTADEKRWIDGVNAALADRPPKNLRFYSTGDCALKIYDGKQQRAVDAIADRLDSDLGETLSCIVQELDVAFIETLKFPHNVDNTIA